MATRLTTLGKRWVAAGYEAVKFGWEPMGESEAVDLDLVRGARRGLGDDATLLIDAGCIWDARTALQRAEKFNAFNIGWLEEPLREDDVDGYVWLRGRSPVPIASGEGECGRNHFDHSSIAKHSISIRLIWRGTDSPKPHSSAVASKKSGHACAITVTQVR